MTIEEKLAILSDILECDASALSPEMSLSDIEEWDSLSALSYIMYMLDNYGIKKTGAEVRNFKTVKDLIDTLQ